MACLSEEQVTAYLADTLNSSEQARLDQHLAGCPDCAAIMTAFVSPEQEPATMAVGVPSDPRQEGAEVLKRGTLLGRYVVLEQIGTGGLGQVYAAFDPELDRKVAVKLLKPSAKSVDGNQLLQVRLLREAQAMAKLSHPNVVTVYDVGTLGDQVFIAMELIDGLTLRQWGKAERRTWRAIRDVMLEVGQGLIAAHDAELIHRDLKPGNILISKDGRVRVLDFGIARGMGQSAIDELGEDDVEFLDEVDSELTQLEQESHTVTEAGELDTVYSLMTEALTRTGMFMGTPGYMPPEQYDPNAELDARADQFAFCVTLHEILYRRRPFRGKDVKSLRFAARTKQIVPERKKANVPSWLRAVILRGLEPRADDRYPSMHELIKDMTRDRRVRKKQRLTVAGAALVSGLGVFATMALAEPGAEETAIVEQLTNEARAAAARSYYVYPPSDSPKEDTAYGKLLQLEDVEGDAESLADTRTEELRTEFSSTLARLGDYYWEEDGGKPFAVDYYVQALFFDPKHPRATERQTLTPGELAVLREKADTQGFTEAELQVTDSLAALAVTDENERSHRLAKLYARKTFKPSVSTSARLERLLGQPSTEALRSSGVRGPTAASEPGSDPELEPESEPEPDPRLDPKPTSKRSPAGESRPSGGVSRRSGYGSSPTRTRNPKKATAEATTGRAAFKAGKLGQAEAAYHRALAADNRNSSALYGLTELHFERSQYLKASRFGRRAIGLSPKNAKLRILLGDAYFKLSRHDDAREQYSRAQQLGHKAAATRIRRLNKVLGK